MTRVHATAPPLDRHDAEPAAPSRGAVHVEAVSKVFGDARNASRSA